MALSLSELGLNKYEEKVYLALVEEGISTAKSISDITGIPYGKVYEVMNSLSGKGFLTILPTKPMKYQAVSPREAVISTKKAFQEKLDKLEAHILKELEPAFARTKRYSEPKAVFWLINGRSNVNKKVEELLKKAKENVKILTFSFAFFRSSSTFLLTFDLPLISQKTAFGSEYLFVRAKAGSSSFRICASSLSSFS